MSIAYLNGEFLPLAEARISPLDRGFIYGDGVYEVIPVYNRRFFYLDAHLQRLENSLLEARMNNPMAREAWVEMLTTLMNRNDGNDQAVYLQVTRGAGKRQHHFLPDVSPTIFAMSWEIQVTQPTPACAITLPDDRWLHCNIKTTALLANVLHRQRAIDAGCKEAILLRDGQLTEGAASNVFIVKAGKVATPAKNHLILAGITRDVVLSLLVQHGIPCEERDISADELRAADEIWLSSSTNEVCPLAKLDDEMVGDGTAPLWEQIWHWYQALKTN